MGSLWLSTYVTELVGLGGEIVVMWDISSQRLRRCMVQQEQRGASVGGVSTTPVTGLTTHTAYYEFKDGTT